MAAARLVLAADDVVGESIIWAPQEAQLYWVDIVGSRIHRLDPATGEHHLWETPELPTSIGLRRGGGFIVGLRQRVTFWRPDGPFETFAVPEPDKPGNRLNEGVVAPDGSFWVGTMQDNINPDRSPKEMTASIGALYRIAPDGKVTQLTAAAFGITNTMVWTDDGRFITADTLKNTLYVYDYDDRAKRLSNRRIFAELDRALPDGSTRDAAGNVYNCRVVGGSAVARLAPDGTLLGYLDLPCASPTSCTFGGPELKTLYVTSSRFGLTEDERRARPQEGAVFAIDTDWVGAASNFFG